MTRLNFLIIFFVSVFSSEPEFSTNDHVYHSYTGETIQDFSCPEADVEKLLLDLNTNKACGPDVRSLRHGNPVADRHCISIQKTPFLNSNTSFICLWNVYEFFALWGIPC